MAAPGTPTNFQIQQANGQVLLTWNIVAGALQYSVTRSTDQVNYTQIATPSVPQYLDTAVTLNTQYWYKIAAVGTTSAFATATLTFSGQPVATDTVQIANTTFTAVASGATGTQFNIGSTVAETITNLVAVINANLTNIVIATATSATLLTIQAYQLGPEGNGLQFSNALTSVVGVGFTGGTAGLSSPYTSPQSAIPTLIGQMSLAAVRLLAKQRADRVNSQFVTDTEWNTYINQSAFELYDLLVTLYEDYHVAPSYTFTTDGVNAFYDLPNGSNYGGIAPFYKLMGVDLALQNATNAFVTLKKFNFISRNRYLYPSVTSTFLGVFNMQYRVLGNQIEFIPTPQAGQIIRVWYVPRMRPLLLDTDILDGVSGWTEYVVVDAAIKALAKEESDTSVLMAAKADLINRINASGMNRDAGAPDTISMTRTWNERWGGSVGYDGNWGGY